MTDFDFDNLNSELQKVSAAEPAPKRPRTYQHRPEPLLLRITDVEAVVAFKKSSIYAWVKDGRFPAPVEVMGNNRWLMSDVKDWLEGEVTSR